MLAGDTLHARIYVPEPLRARVQPGLDARIRVDGLVDEIEGTVTFVSSEAAFHALFSLTQRDAAASPTWRRFRSGKTPTATCRWVSRWKSIFPSLR